MARSKQESNPAHEDVIVRFDALHFDSLNPRGEPEPDEEKIRAQFGAQSETLKLATHLAENGQNPLDRLGIVAHPKLSGHYVIREGNRRLCAMQLLRDPERAPNKSAARAFKSLANTGVPIPDEIQAVLFHDNRKARTWMSVKHEGPQGGLGTLPWGAKEKARFNREGSTGATRPKNPNRQADAILTFAVNEGLISDEERKRIALTTITRYLPNLRSALALVNSEDCHTTARPEDFKSALARFLKDSVDPDTPGSTAKVHSRSTSVQRNEYAETLRQDGYSPVIRDQSPYDPSIETPPKRAPKENTSSRGPQHPSKRKYLIPEFFKLVVAQVLVRRRV